MPERKYVRDPGRPVLVLNQRTHRRIDLRSYLGRRIKKPYKHGDGVVVPLYGTVKGRKGPALFFQSSDDCEACIERRFEQAAPTDGPR